MKDPLLLGYEDPNARRNSRRAGSSSGKPISLGYENPQVAQTESYLKSLGTTRHLQNPKRYKQAEGLLSRMTQFDIETGGLNASDAVYEYGFSHGFGERGWGGNQKTSHEQFFASPGKDLTGFSDFSKDAVAERGLEPELLRSQTSQKQGAFAALEKLQGRDVFIQNVKFESDALRNKMTGAEFGDWAENRGNLESYSPGDRSYQGKLEVSSPKIRGAVSRATAAQSKNVGNLDNYLDEWRGVFGEVRGALEQGAPEGVTRIFEQQHLTRSVFAMAQQKDLMPQTGELWAGTSMETLSQAIFGKKELHAAGADAGLQGKVAHWLLGVGLDLEAGDDVGPGAKGVFKRLGEAQARQKQTGAVSRIQNVAAAQQKQSDGEWLTNKETNSLRTDFDFEKKNPEIRQVRQPDGSYAEHSTPRGQGRSFGNKTKSMDVDEVIGAWEANAANQHGITPDYTAARIEAIGFDGNINTGAKESLASTTSSALTGKQSAVDAALTPAVTKNVNWRMGAAVAAGIFAGNLLFSSSDDEYNSIEGLRHGGFSGNSRRYNTDFGSGWNALRGLTRAGETFAEMTASKGFQEALRGGRSIKELGKGGFGSAALHKGSFRGSDFDFVRKTGNIKEYEVAALKAVEGGNSPSYYANSTAADGVGTLDMEFFPPLAPDNARNASKISKGEFSDALNKVHNSGYSHGDLHPENLVFTQTPEGVPKVGILDFGEAFPVQPVDVAEDFRRGGHNFDVMKSDAYGASPAGKREFHEARRALLNKNKKYGFLRRRNAERTDLEKMEFLGVNPFRAAKAKELRQKRIDRRLNPIEGMGHAGIAGATRKKNTEFGSQWQGPKSGLLSQSELDDLLDELDELDEIFGKASRSSEEEAFALKRKTKPVNPVSSKVSSAPAPRKESLTKAVNPVESTLKPPEPTFQQRLDSVVATQPRDPDWKPEPYTAEEQARVNAAEAKEQKDRKKGFEANEERLTKQRLERARQKVAEGKKLTKGEFAALEAIGEAPATNQDARPLLSKAEREKVAEEARLKASREKASRGEQLAAFESDVLEKADNAALTKPVNPVSSKVSSAPAPRKEVLTKAVNPVESTLKPKSVSVPSALDALDIDALASSVSRTEPISTPTNSADLNKGPATKPVVRKPTPEATHPNRQASNVRPATQAASDAAASKGAASNATKTVASNAIEGISNNRKIGGLVGAAVFGLGLFYAMSGSSKKDGNNQFGSAWQGLRQFFSIDNAAGLSKKGKKAAGVSKKLGRSGEKTREEEEEEARRRRAIAMTNRIKSSSPVNPIDGMAHSGMANATRSSQTDFGSPWHGLNQGYAGQVASREILSYKVEDADTVQVMLSGGNSLQLRLAGIDAPETEHGDSYASKKVFQKQPFGKRATQMLKELMDSQHKMTVAYNPVGSNTYGRTPALLMGDKGQNLNLRLVEMGAAASLPYGKASDRLASASAFNKAEKAAVSSGAGMWGDPGWQAAHRIQQESKRRMTHNSFTDLGKLYGNFKTSAIVHRLRNGDAGFSEMGAAGGRSDFNVIEGLKHGWAQSNREANIGDFGSGYIVKKVTRSARSVAKGTSVKKKLMSGQSAANTRARQMMDSQNWTSHQYG